MLRLPKHIERLSHWNPLVPELWANLGLMDHESGKHLEAIRSFQQASQLNPSLFVPQLFLGLEYLQSNKAEAALPHLENAVKLNPTRSSGIALPGKGTCDARPEREGH